MKQVLQENKINIRLKISFLWMGMMMLYIYNDFFHLFPPDSLQKIMDGNMGPLTISQLNLFMAALLMAIPVILSVVTLYFSSKTIRVINIVFGVLYTFVNIGNIIGETWIFYIFLGIIQVGITLAIVGSSLKWPKMKLSSY